MRLHKKVVIITGAGSGIGRVMALLFASEGGAVVVADRNRQGGQETLNRIQSAGGEGMCVEMDVTRATDVERTVQQTLDTYGRVDILVNNAAICEGDDILEIDEAMWDRNLDVVLKGVYLCSRAVLPQMLQQQHGVIVNIASVNGLTAVGNSAYSAAKAGVISLTQTMAIHYGPQGIRVNAICPGTIETEIWASRVAQDPHIFERLGAWYPLKRVGKPEDVAYCALYLASDEATFVTGAVFVVDGGLTAGSLGWYESLKQAETE